MKGKRCPSFVKRRALPGIRPGEIILYLLLLILLGLGPIYEFVLRRPDRHKIRPKYVFENFAVFELFLSRSTFLVIRSFFPARVRSTRTR